MQSKFFMLMCLLGIPFYSNLQAVSCGTPCTTKSCLTKVIEQACLQGDTQVAANLLASAHPQAVCDVIQCICDEECLGRILFHLAKRVGNGQGDDAVTAFIKCLCTNYDMCCDKLTNIVTAALAYSFSCDPSTNDQCDCPSDSAPFVLVKTIFDAGCPEILGVVLYKLVKNGTPTADIITFLRGLIIWLTAPCCEEMQTCLQGYHLNDYSTTQEEEDALMVCVTDSLRCVVTQFDNHGGTLKTVFCRFVSSMVADPGLGYTSVSSFIMKLVQSLLVDFNDIEANPGECFQDLIHLLTYAKGYDAHETVQQLNALLPSLCSRFFCLPFVAKVLSVVYIGFALVSGIESATILSGSRQTFTYDQSTCCVGPASTIIILIDVLLRFIDGIACGFSTDSCNLTKVRFPIPPFTPPYTPAPYVPEEPYYPPQPTSPCAQLLENMFPNATQTLQTILAAFAQLIEEITGSNPVAPGESLDETLRVLFAFITGQPVPASFDQTCCMTQLFLCFSTARALQPSQSTYLKEWALANPAQGAVCLGQAGACSVSDPYLCENDPCTFFFTSIVKQFLQAGLVDNAVILTCCASNLGTAGLDCLITSIYNPAWLATLLVGMKLRNEFQGYPSCNYNEFLERICCLDSDKACLVWQNVLSAGAFLECADPNAAGILSALVDDIQSLCYPTILPCVLCNLVSAHQSLDSVCNILNKVQTSAASTADFNAFVCEWFNCLAENCAVGVAGATALLNCLLNCPDYASLGQSVLDALCCCDNADKWTKVIVDVLDWRTLSGKSLPSIGGGCL